eukprot:SAG31_NODE_4255_length_3414_cov_4.628959_2_plen_63_part_00
MHLHVEVTTTAIVQIIESTALLAARQDARILFLPHRTRKPTHLCLYILIELLHVSGRAVGAR